MANSKWRPMILNRTDGEYNRNAILTKDDILEIRADYDAGKCRHEEAKKRKITAYHWACIGQRKVWRSVK